MQEQQQQQYPDLGATPIRTDLLTRHSRARTRSTRWR
jgi:hypothetical protein